MAAAAAVVQTAQHKTRQTSLQRRAREQMIWKWRCRPMTRKLTRRVKMYNHSHPQIQSMKRLLIWCLGSTIYLGEARGHKDR